MKKRYVWYALLHMRLDEFMARDIMMFLEEHGVKLSLSSIGKILQEFVRAGYLERDRITPYQCRHIYFITEALRKARRHKR